MKIPSFFSKTPKHKKFSFTPRFYDEREEELKERQERIRREIESKKENGESTENLDPSLFSHRDRIAGSFTSSTRRSIYSRSSPSTMLIRLVLFAFITIWVIVYLQYGNVAFYGLLLIFPVYFLMRSGGSAQRRR